MAKIKAFKGVRPIPEKAIQVASRPYDVMNTAEARDEAKGNPYSFLNVVKPEISFPDGHDPYASEIYQKGKENFQKMVDEGVLIQDQKDCLYLYRISVDNHSQVGYVACASIHDYFNDIIKKHELTRPDKEADRKKHVRVGMMNAEPVFFAYPNQKALDEIADKIVTQTPEYNFMAEDGVQHEFWVIGNESVIAQIIQEFEKLPATYVADGHHRTAAAALVGKDLQEENPNHSGAEEYNYFLAVHFPDNQLQIIDYNRVVKDLNGLAPVDFVDKLKTKFEVEKKGKEIFKPAELHTFGMYLEGNWYSLKAKTGTFDDHDPIGVLDVTILSEQILKPVLGIFDLRTDKRIEFVGGGRGLGELEKRVDSGDMKVAFALFPVSMKQLIDIADGGKIMPPKVTWFEPKLRSGLVTHLLS
ncbi:MAG: DUF1015 family protein [Flammeovirgaceae bacterium]|nr:DUF1015 family protein [Flammeovirgaceae bacterium]